MRKLLNLMKNSFQMDPNGKFSKIQKFSLLLGKFIQVEKQLTQLELKKMLKTLKQQSQFIKNKNKCLILGVFITSSHKQQNLKLFRRTNNMSSNSKF
ncbi:hypothetical protein FGO68_gene6861 [Halteria grandinella]|uniref:Uncharacterized protein n=1 Tax=Halteria grandinella TaxID=5974 RepID=A0A8J8NBQ2_HALGN|nr:hypothetical protein FGO68_gene6861 [Halteria grandinella]